MRQNTAPTALSPKLDSPYSAEATPSPDPNLTPSSEARTSSTAVDPPNEVLRKKVLEGNMPERNPMPTGEVG